jgi:hypothetical protein
MHNPYLPARYRSALRLIHRLCRLVAFLVRAGWGRVAR